MPWRFWIGKSFSRKVATQAVANILFASLLLCAIGFAGSLWLLGRQQDRDLAARLDHAAERLVGRVGIFEQTAAELAGNPLISTALLDSRDRDIYLKPFLGNYRLPVQEPHALALCDYRGQPLAGTKGAKADCHADLPLLTVLFERETAQSTILVAPDGAVRLLTLQPVKYPGTGHAEGYVAATLDLRAVLANVASENDYGLRLRSADRHVAIALGRLDDPGAEAGQEIILPGLAGSFQLTLSETRRTPEGFATVLAAYGVGVAAAVLLAWSLALRMGRRLTEPLAALSRSAARIADEGAAATRLVEVQGEDEIARLALSLNTMLEALKRSHDHLEDQVADRTRALNQALAAARASEERYRSLFAGSKVAMLLIDPDDGQIVDANHAAADYYGWPVGMLKQMLVSQINMAHPDDIAAEMARAADESRSHFLFRHRLASGEFRDVEVHAGPVELNGRMLLLSIVHDVTERTRLERERQRLVTAIEQSPVSVVITSPDAVIEYVNDAFTRTTGYSREEAIGQNPRLLKSGETSEGEYQAIWAMLAAGKPWSGTFHNKRKDGTLYWEQARIFPMLDAAGAITHYVGIKEDITERRRAEEVIRVLNRRYQDVLSAASEVSIIATDPDGLVTVFNRGAEKLLGFPAEAVVGRHSPELFHLAEEVDARRAELAAELGRPVTPFEAFIVKALADGSEKREWTYVRRDGAHLTVSLVVTPVYSADNTLSGYLGVAVDITERKAAERRLAESEERFRTLVEGTTDWVWETDDQHRFTWFSPTFEAILGSSPARLLGLRRWDLASDQHEIDTAVWQAHIEDLTALRSFRDFRYWLRTAKGDARWISISGSPRFDEDGKFLGYRGSGTDISFEAAAALRLKMLSTVVEQSPVSVLITDPEGVIEYANSHFTTVTGFPPEEAIGRRASMVASGETPPELYRELWSTITAGRQWRGELKNRKKTGEIHWEAVAISPIVNDEHRVVHYVAVKEDITFRKEAEARISDANRRLQAVNAELEQFAYVASHDLRQPLRMVTSYLQLIERQLGGTADEDLKEFLAFAMGGARKMDRLILDLLEYSRTGRHSAPFEPVSLAETAKDALGFLEVAIGEAEATVTVADNLPTVLGTPSELVRLFQNLIGNAIKYRDPARKPVVAVECVDAGPAWEIAIRDNGIGIKPEDRDRAFLIFQRLVAMDAYEGTGIGLAVCRKIVEHHGGRIWIDSTPGEGSTFRFTLPKAALS